MAEDRSRIDWCYVPVVWSVGQSKNKPQQIPYGNDRQKSKKATHLL